MRWLSPRPLTAALAVLVVASAGCLEASNDGDDSLIEDDTTSPTPTSPPASDDTRPADDPVPPDTGGDGDGDDVDWRRLDQGTTSGRDDRAQLVFDDEDAWLRFWDEHTSRQLPSPEPPEVDFATDRVAVVLMGEQNSGCYGTTVTSVKNDGETTTVFASERGPSPERECTSNITQPFDIVAFPKDGSNVTFSIAAWE